MANSTTRKDLGNSSDYYVKWYHFLIDLGVGKKVRQSTLMKTKINFISKWSFYPSFLFPAYYDCSSYCCSFLTRIIERAPIKYNKKYIVVERFPTMETRNAFGVELISKIPGPKID